MRRTLRIVALGSAFLAPAALTDVTINGSINMGIEYLNVGSESDVFANRRAAAGLGMQWNLASGYVGASWMQAMDASCNFATPLGLGCEDTGAYSIGLGYYHTMSKQTQLYVVGSWLDNQDQGNYGTAGISNSALYNNVGATIWSVGVGIVHSF
jgi:predicted porin